MRDAIAGRAREWEGGGGGEKEGKAREKNISLNQGKIHCNILQCGRPLFIVPRPTRAFLSELYFYRGRS